MKILDFARARIAWTTHDGSHGLWGVAAAARREDGREAWFLAAGVMAGDVYGQGRLPLQPAYSFQLAATSDRHVIFREAVGAPDLPDTDAPHSDSFSTVAIDAPEVAAQTVPVGSLIAQRPWPLTARLTAYGSSGARWTLAFPVNHLNLRAPSAWQLETGPIIVPCDTIEIGGAAKPGGVQLAFAFAARSDQVDLLGFGPTGDGRRGFAHFARLQGVALTFFATQVERGSPGAM